MTTGTDTSFYAERVLSYEKMAQSAEFTIIRAGQGAWIDNYFEKNRTAAKGILPRGAYWFYDGRYKPARQAELFATALGDDLMELPLWADYERDDKGAAYGSWKNFHTFLRELKRRLPGKEIGIYTGYYYWLEHVPERAHRYFKDYPLWLAWYADLDRVMVPQPWEELTLWQFTERGDGKLYGLNPLVKKAIDLNYYMGDDFDGFAGASKEPPPAEPLPTDNALITIQYSCDREIVFKRNGD